MRPFAHPHSGEKIKGTNKVASIIPKRAAPRVSMWPPLHGNASSLALGRSVPSLGAEEIPAPNEDSDRDRGINKEYPAPAEMGDNEAAQGWAQSEAEVGDHEVEAERPAPLFRRERRGHDGRTRGGEQRATHPLKDPGHNEKEAVRGERRHHREKAEKEDPKSVEAQGAPHVGQAPHGDDENGDN